MTTPVEKPSDAEYQVIISQLNGAETRLYQLELLEIYEATHVPGWEPRSLWEETYGVKGPKATQLHGEKLARAISAAQATVAILRAHLEDWNAREQAYHERPSDEEK